MDDHENSMKKTSAILAASAAIAYPASAWWLGGQIEAGYGQQYEQLAGIPYLRLVDQAYQRGVFSSSASATFELSEEWFDAVTDGQGRASGAPPRVTLRSAIRHGPLPGGSSPGAGTADIEIVLDEEMRREIARVIGDKPPLRMQIAFGFDGGGVATASIPAFTYTATGADGGEPEQLSWGGANLVLNFSNLLERYSLRFDAPYFELRQGEEVLKWSGAKASADLQRTFEDEPLFYAGSMRLALAQLEASVLPMEADPGRAMAPEALQTVRVEQLEYDIDYPLQGDYIDLAARLGARVLRIGDTDYGPAHYDVSLSRIHARTAARMHRQLVEQYADPQVQAAAAHDPSVLLAPLAEPAMTLLAHNPELRLDRISFRSAHGNARIAARAKFDDLRPEDVGNPFALLFKLDAYGEFSLPLALVEELQLSALRTDPDLPDALVQQRKRQFDAQLDALIGQGYVVREEGLLRSRIAFKAGELKVNDLPFNPMAMGQGR